MLSLGVVGTSRKPDERRLPIHPAHVERIDAGLRERIFLERGYGERFGIADDVLGPLVGGLRTRDELLAESDVVLLPKPLVEDVEALRDGQTLWGWPHLVQDEAMTQAAIDRRLTVIAWEAMNFWHGDGGFNVHVFHKNNELAGYASVLHAMELLGRTGSYGPPLTAAVLSFGATARGAVTALTALGVHEVTVLTQRDPASVASPIHTVKMVNYDRSAEHPRRAVTLRSPDPAHFVEQLGKFDIVVNCVFQDTEDPVIFVMTDELDRFRPGALIVDVSIDEGMGFEWASPTSFADPLRTVGDGVHYYAVDHSPSHLWDSATWEVSEALLPFLPTVMAGPSAWDGDEPIRRAIEIREGVVVNERILSFQGRAKEHPHGKFPDTGALQ
jgi:alanine dehydrogenase